MPTELQVSTDGAASSALTLTRRSLNPDDLSLAVRRSGTAVDVLTGSQLPGLPAHERQFGTAIDILKGSQLPGVPAHERQCTGRFCRHAALRHGSDIGCVRVPRALSVHHRQRHRRRKQ